MPLVTKSIILAKLAGAPLSPIGLTHHWYRVSLPGTVNAVYCFESSAKRCCQKPAVRSKAEKTLDPFWPTWSTHSRTSLMVYLSGTEAWLMARKSRTILLSLPPLEWGFGTEKIGEL